MILLTLLACGEVDGETGDTACADTPSLTWDNFGEGFMIQHCQSCHASESPSRQGAPESVTFDTEEETLEQADRIRARVLESVDMPPQGGVTDDDLQKLEWWLDCR